MIQKGLRSAQTDFENLHSNSVSPTVFQLSFPLIQWDMQSSSYTQINSTFIRDIYGMVDFALVLSVDGTNNAVHLNRKLLCINFLFVKLLHNHKHHCSLSPVVEYRHTMILHFKNIQYFLKFYVISWFVHFIFVIFAQSFRSVMSSSSAFFAAPPQLYVLTLVPFSVNALVLSLFFISQEIGTFHLTTVSDLDNDHGPGFLPLFVPVLW